MMHILLVLSFELFLNRARYNPEPDILSHLVEKEDEVRSISHIYSISLRFPFVILVKHSQNGFHI